MIALAPVRSSPPAVPLLDADGARAHLRLDGPDDDPLVTALIAAAEALLDGYSGITGRALVTQRWTQSFDRFPICDRFRLPLGPLRAVDSITYIDTAGNDQEFTAFHAVSDAIGPLIVLEFAAWWPLTAIRPDAVTVNWTCGYGDSAAAVPPPIIHALKLLIGDWYQNREDTIAERSVVPTALPNGVAQLLAPFRATGI